MAVTETGFIERVSLVADRLDEISSAVTLFNQPTIDALSSLAGLDLATVITDLKKSNYLGNRKIDIDLTLNNLSTVTNVAYQQADVMLQDGTYVNIPFYATPGDVGSGISELTSHADIKNYIANDAGYIAQVAFTELTVEPAIGILPEVIRFRDSDGKSSNVDKVTLTTFSGTPAENVPDYFWAKTTSSLQTIANRVSDIIKLGDNIDDIIALSIISADVSALVAISADITTVAASAANVDAIATTVVPNIAEILLADDNAASATASAAAANTSDLSAEDANLESGDWANQTVDVLTRTFTNGTPTNRAAGNYSSLHHASKASFSASTSASEAANAATSASNSSTSASAADASSVAAEDANLESNDWANQSVDVLTRTFSGTIPTSRGAGNYSASHHAIKASEFAGNASTSATNAATSETNAATSEGNALTHYNNITTLTAAANSLVAGSAASATYSSGTGILTIGVPVGTKGDKGDSFTVDATGTLAGRSAYDGAATGFSYLTIDEAPNQIYFKNSATNADWSVGLDFGKGDTGDTGAAGASILAGAGVPTGGLGTDGDLYIDTTNGDLYSKAAGVWTLDSNLSATIDDAVTNLINTYSSTKIEDLISTHNHSATYEPKNANIQAHVTSTANPHTVTKAQVGLGSADDTSDINKPVSTAQQTALDLKLNTANIDLDQGASI